MKRWIFFAFLVAALNLNCKRRGGELEISGYLEARKVDLSPRLSQRILDIKVEEGDRVIKRDTLVILDSREIESLIEEARLKIEAGRAKIEQLRAELELGREDLKRLEELFRKGSVPEEKLRIQRTKVKVLKSSLKEAEKTLEATETRLSYLKLQRDECFLLSPINGVVLERNFEVGEVAIPGSPVLTLASLDTLRLIAFLPALDMGRVSLGDSAWITVDAYPDTAFMGIVKKINDEAVFVPKNVQTKRERTKLVFEVHIYVPNDSGLLKPGLFADARFKTSH
jgi:HlyD family secretion protein